MKILIALIISAVVALSGLMQTPKPKTKPTPLPRPSHERVNPPSDATQKLIQKAKLDGRKPVLAPSPAPTPKQKKSKKNHAFRPPFAQIPVASGANLQTAINSASCGDFLNLEAGATWDGQFTISQNCSAGNPLTIRSANFASLPNGMIGTTQSDTNAYSTNMARIRALGVTGYGGSIILGTNAGGITFDGIEFTDNAASTGIIAVLIDAGLTNTGIHDLIITRSWFHQKETGTDYNRIIQRAVWFEGQDFLMKWSYVYLIGYYNPASVGGEMFAQMDTTAFLCVGTGDDITLTESFFDCWWNTWFLGGADTAAQNTANLTSATTTSATFDNVTGLAANVVLRLTLTGTGTWDNGTKVLTQTGGTALNAGDGGRGLDPAQDSGTAIILTPSGGGASSVNTKLGGPISPPSIPIIGNNGSVGASGNYDFVVFQTAIVTSVVGSTVNYVAFGIDQIRHTGAVRAAWNTGDQGLITDCAFTKNRVYLNPLFAEDVYFHKGYCNKGIWETKNVNRELIEGNYFNGMPAMITWTAANQNGTAPWIKVDNMTIQNNWNEPDTGHPNCTRFFITIADDGYLNTIAQSDASVTLPNTIIIYNNLVLNTRSFLDTKYAKDWYVTHNTAMNDQGTSFGVNALVSNQTGPVPNFIFTDNIGGVVCYGFHDYPSAYPGATINHNVLVDADFGCSGGITVNTFGTASALPPIPTLYSQVGWTNLGGQIFSLAPSSNYYHQGNSGTDPGVDWPALLAALGTTASGTAVSGKVVISGKTVIH